LPDMLGDGAHLRLRESGHQKKVVGHAAELAQIEENQVLALLLARQLHGAQGKLPPGISAARFGSLAFRGGSRGTCVHSAGAADRVIDRVAEGALDRAIRLGAEETLGLVRVNPSAAHRVDEAVTLFDETHQLLELGAAELALGGEHREPLALLALERSESTDERQRHFAFAQIGAELLSGFGGMAEEI